MHIHIKKVPDTIDGFLHSFTSDGRVKIKVSFGVTSDKPEFYQVHGGNLGSCQE